MVKICQTGLLKLNFETIPKTHFPVFAKNFRRPWMKLKNFFGSIYNYMKTKCGKTKTRENFDTRQHIPVAHARIL
jgi:hypothetical protein